MIPTTVLLQWKFEVYTIYKLASYWDMHFVETLVCLLLTGRALRWL